MKHPTLLILLLAFANTPRPACAENLLTIDNGTVKIGIDRSKGGAITWLSSRAYPRNMVNVADPGRLIQQSYYAGKVLDRRQEGQNSAWSPWPWNPIQGGGVGSWAVASKIERTDTRLYSETTPKLWDMPNEEAQALMRQTTSFEPSIVNAVMVRCESVSLRDEDDRWGESDFRAQEVPACYFTRNFAHAKSYLGEGQWREETQPPGPPWGQTNPPRKALAVFDRNGHGVAVFSPTSNLPWNFGPHGNGLSDDATAGPCMHVAPIARQKLARKSTFRYRYWLVVGNSEQLARSLDKLWTSYASEGAEVR